MRRRWAVLGEGDPQIDEATRRVTVGVAAGTGQLIAELPSLYAVGAALEDVAVRHPKLDEVFLALTGQSPQRGLLATAADRRPSG